MQGAEQDEGCAGDGGGQRGQRQEVVVRRVGAAEGHTAEQPDRDAPEESTAQAGADADAVPGGVQADAGWQVSGR